MEIVPYFSHRAEVLPNNEENIKQLYTDQLRLRQRPGNKNALGDIKPNDYAIYLHDTPFKDLFRQTKRDFSHGYIRVENPKALAKFILKNRKNWNKEKTNATLKTKEPTIVGVLSSKIPVVIFYTTVLPHKTDVSFYPDIYDLDKPLIAALTARSQSISIN
jgi:murein L,D-transpeptidase YcbB/YkuD